VPPRFYRRGRPELSAAISTRVQQRVHRPAGPRFLAGHPRRPEPSPHPGPDRVLRRNRRTRQALAMRSGLDAASWVLSWHRVWVLALELPRSA